MKKVLYLILGVLLFIPALVNADMGAPIIRGYVATPKSSSGADIYRYDQNKDAYVKTGRKLEYRKTINIIMEDEYVSVDVDDEDNEDVVKMSDLMPVEKVYKVNSKELSKEYEVLILKKREIKNGPANGYDSTGKTIPSGVKVKVKYFDPDSKGNAEFSGDTTSWAYVEYNGAKGFIDTEGSIATDPVYTTVIASADVKVYGPGTEKQVATIKANTKFNATVYMTDVWTGGYYIEYNNIKGVVSDDYHFYPKRKAISFKPIEKITAYESLKYNDAGDIISKVATTIPKGTSFKSEYYFMHHDSAIVYYDGLNVKGWIEVEGRSVNPDDEDSEYLEANKILGFNESSDVSIVAIKKEEQKPDETSEQQPVEVTPNTEVENKENKKQEDIKQEEVEKVTKKIPQIVYICLGIAVIVTLTAVVTAILVNNKNKNQYNGFNNY